jgi:hypothetical protein
MKKEKSMETFHKKVGFLRKNLYDVMEEGLRKMDKSGYPFVLTTYNKISRDVIMNGFKHKAETLNYLETLGYKGNQLTRSFRAASNKIIKNDVYIDHHCIGFDF